MRVNKQIAALALSAVMGTAVFSAMPVMAAGTVQSAEASSSQEQSKMRKGPEDRISELVENGTISKETGEKISNYMKENRPEKKEKASGTEKPEKKEKASGTENASGTEKKEKKEKKTAADSADSTTAATEKTGSKSGNGRGGKGHGHGFLSQEFLDKLLADKVITQEEYDALKAAIPERPEKPADGENGQTRQKRTKQKKNTTTNTTTGTT